MSHKDRERTLRAVRIKKALADGMSIEVIAKAEGVLPAHVKKSILMFERDRTRGNWDCKRDPVVKLRLTRDDIFASNGRSSFGL